MAGNEQANISKYKGAFKGTVTKEFTTPKPFVITTVRAGAMINEFGYGEKVGHATPTDPHGGRK